MKLKFILPAFLSLLIFISCEKKTTEPTEEEYIETNIPLTVEEINTIIINSLQTTGDFYWADVDDHTLWSGIVQGEGCASIGYGEYAWLQEDPVIDAELAKIREELINLVLESEKKANSSLTASDIVLDYEDFFTHVTLKIKLLETVTALRAYENLRFLEANYDKLKK